MPVDFGERRDYRANPPAVPQDSRRVVQEWSHDYLDADGKLQPSLAGW